jgi:hypothetical protein
MALDTQPGLIVFTPEGSHWAKEYLMRESLFTVSPLHLDIETFSDLASDEISTSGIGVHATVDATYRKGLPDEQQLKMQVLIKWEYVATIFFAKELKKHVLGFKITGHS